MGKDPESGLENTSLKMWYILDESRCTVTLGIHTYISHVIVTSAEYLPVGLLSTAINEM